jgi:hypothetical protein
MQTPQQAGRERRYARREFDWLRFWIRTAIAVVAFNIVAGLVTWYLIFPRLHPSH